MFLTAVVIGFAGSLHCLGMCSPLLMAVTRPAPGVVLSRLLYNAGRILTYAMMGATVSLLGKILAIGDYQNALSLALGILLLIVGLSGVNIVHIPFVSTALKRFNMALKDLFQRVLAKNGRATLFLTGALNGLLPCGLTFIALSYCAGLRGPIDGFNFMLSFGLGTLPVMLGFTSLLHYAIKKYKLRLQSISAGMIILSACLLIARSFLLHETHHHIPGELDVVDIIMCGRS